MITYNVYEIPVASMIEDEYFNFVTSLPIQFNSERFLFADPHAGIVKVDGTITGYTSTGTIDIE